MQCEKCGYLNDVDAEFCESCGNALIRLCHNCGSPLKPGASFCKKCGAPVARSQPTGGVQETPIEQKKEIAETQQAAQVKASHVEGERKPTTILFADIVGSTSLAEKIDPEEWKEVVSGAHQRVIQAIHRYEGTVAQLLGDGVLAFFGAPITHEDDPVRAVRAALDIQQDISDYAYQLKGYIANFQMRVGLNTGMVVVGSLGSELHMEYLAIGDAVNLAARLQSAAQPGSVLISENTARLVKNAFELKSLGEITVKGKAEPVAVYEVVERKATPESGRGFEELDSPLVGRANELTELTGALDELKRGHGQIVAVLGEAGIGKSRLVEEARRSIGSVGDEDSPSGSQALHWIEGRALSYGASLSFWTISQLIKNDLGLSDADPEPRMRVALGRRVRALFSKQADQVLPYLARLLGVKLDPESAERISLLDSETLKRQTLTSITKYFERLALLQPTVAVFEDLHWVDTSSLEALELLLGVTDRAPLMVLILTRLEREHPSWRIKLIAETDFAHRYTEIQLKPLSASQQDQLVDNLLKIADLPGSLRELIQEHAEGNPFYLEEIVRSLIEQGAIVRQAEHWKATQQILDVTIPDTLQGVLLARLDRLQEDVRRTLQLASVIGRSFLYSILEAISEAEQALDRHLAQLQRVDLVREKARLPDLEYMFKHSLTQEAAYSSLLVARRSEFHRKVGEALEKLFPGRLEEFYGILAHHFEAANENQKAVDYLIKAGEKARSMAELSEAISYFQRTIPLLTEVGDTERLAQMWLKLGLVYCNNFQYEEAHQANEQAFALRKPLGVAQLVSEPKMRPALLRTRRVGGHFNLDPGLVSWTADYEITSNLFTGLVQVDSELNIVPDVARSWQVLDGGRKYLFSLRDDVRWSDGISVTAQDFEFAMKRNLQSKYATEFGTAQLLFDVAGAQDYSEGKNPDPENIGVHALDTYSLEIQLAEPVAYFLYILSLPIAYPLPRHMVNILGDHWSKPGKMVSNGPYRLVESEVHLGSVIERNPYYFGDFTGNADRVEFGFSREISQSILEYQENSTDVLFEDPHEIPASIPSSEIHFYAHPRTEFITIAVAKPPFTDVRVRRAFAMALNRRELADKFVGKIAAAGLIPPGIPGHSPDLGLRFDPQAARQLLAEAGYPEGKGLPLITMVAGIFMRKVNDEIKRQWKENLGVEVSIESKTPAELMAHRAAHTSFHILHQNWTFDYPDPDNMLCQPNAFLDIATLWGWRDEAYHQLVREAGRTPNLKKRMEMYRQADRMVVQEQVVVIPTNYDPEICAVVKPWVKNLTITPTGRIIFKDVIVEEH